MGYTPNLDNPKTMSEKLLVRKLYDRRPILVELTDKLRSKDWIKGRSSAVAIPTLGTGFEIGDILKPPFVVKPTGYSGQTHVISTAQDWKEAKAALKSIAHVPFGQEKGQWAYSQVPFQLLYEPVLENIREFQFFCFDGKAQVIRKNEYVEGQKKVTPVGAKYSYFWRNQEWVDVKKTHHELSSTVLDSDVDIRAMLKCADNLSTGIDFVRVDFYWTPETIYYGEHTFYPSSGHLKYVPKNFDRTLGDLWTLSYR